MQSCHSCMQHSMLTCSIILPNIVKILKWMKNIKMDEISRQSSVSESCHDVQNFSQFESIIPTRRISSYIRDTWESIKINSENLLYVPKPNIEQFRNSLSYSGSKIWNAIPENIKQSDSVQQFKHLYIKWYAAQVQT